MCRLWSGCNSTNYATTEQQANTLSSRWCVCCLCLWGCAGTQACRVVCRLWRPCGDLEDATAASGRTGRQDGGASAELLGELKAGAETAGEQRAAVMNSVRDGL